MSFGIPNGVIKGVEKDVVDEPDVSDASPFNDGVENGDVLREPLLIQTSNVEPNFKVEEPKEEKDEELFTRPVFNNTEDADDVMEEEEENHPSLDDLDDNDIVTGDEYGWTGMHDAEEDGEVSTFIEQDFEFYTDEEEYSDIDEEDEGGLDALFRPGGGLLS
jgi:hypothetical protein